MPRTVEQPPVSPVVGISSSGETAARKASLQLPIAGPLAHLDSLIAQDNTFGLYLEEMKGQKLLTAQEEVELGKRIEAGRKATAKLVGLEAHIRKNGRDGKLGAKLEQFHSAIARGEEAKHDLVTHNRRLVISIAKKYLGRGVRFLDLIQEGHLGLMKAVEKWNYRLGFRFSTYATWWIRQTIRLAIAYQGRTIRVPVHRLDTFRRLYETVRGLTQKLGREPELEEIAQAMDITKEQAAQLHRWAQRPISLDWAVGEDEDESLIEFIPDPESNPETPIEEKTRNQALIQALSTLPARDRRILELRYGLHDGRTYTLEQVGQRFGLTRERIRQLEARALQRLRHPARAKKLMPYAQAQRKKLRE